MKKLVLAATLLLAITGIGFAQTAPAPAAKPAPKTETAKKETKPAKKSHDSHKKTSTDKAATEKKS